MEHANLINALAVVPIWTDFVFKAVPLGALGVGAIVWLLRRPSRAVRPVE